MDTRGPRALIAIVLVAGLAGCSAPSTPVPRQGSSASPVAIESEDAQFECTDEGLTFALDAGYSDAELLVPRPLDIPRVSFDSVPDCLVGYEYEGVERFGALWLHNPQETFSELATALDGAGYVQSPDYGPNTWWYSGDDPSSAEMAVAATLQRIDRTQILWAIW